MQKRTVFLLQSTKELNEELCKLFLSDEKYEVVGMTNEGEKAVEMIMIKRPQFVITELVIGGYDGLMLLNKLRENKIETNVIVLSALCREEIIAQTISAGAKYFIAKPLNFAVLKARMDELSERKETPTESVISKYRAVTLEEKISKIFINVGIPPHIKGYTFLREGVKMAVENPEIINNITKQLYPSIGRKYNTTASKVERAIRHAIEVAWNRGRIETINAIFGVRAYVGQEKPTNGEFIALVADKMLLEKA